MDFAEFRTEIASRLAAGHEDPLDNYVLLPRVDSTNLVARRCIEEYRKEYESPPPLVILAREQSAGRGRRGNSWQSPPGGIYATLVHSLESPDRLPALPLVAAVALARALERHLPCPCRLKWPNDLIAGGGKIGGILIEAVPSPEGEVEVMIGFGVNFQPPPLSTATSVQGLNPDPPALGVLVRDLLESLASALGAATERPPLEEYAALSVHEPGEALSCRVGGERISGTFLGFAPGGALRLLREGKELHLTAGEIVEHVETEES